LNGRLEILTLKLAQAAQALEDAFFTEGRLDPPSGSAWPSGSTASTPLPRRPGT